MKNYEQVTNDLLERRDKYVVEQRKKKKRALYAVAPLCCVCLVALLGFGIWQGEMFSMAPPEHPKGDDLYTADDNSGEDYAFYADYQINDKNDEGATQNNISSSKSSYTESTDTPSDSNDFIDVLGMVIVDGVTYVQFVSTTQSYTPDTCLGDASDFEGTYQTHLCDIAAKLYTTKEDPDILIVKLTNGATVTLVRERN